jgi:SAM-dependent methyltransferase
LSARYIVKTYSLLTSCDDSGVSCPCCPPPASEYRRFFRRKIASNDARRYRRRGLSKTASALVAAVGGESVLDVGGGVGTLALELLERGSSRATVVELSAGYEDAAAELFAEQGLADRVERRIGDFVTEAGLVEPHDVVILHRVVCCYPDADALVSAGAAHARRSLALTYPRRRALTRTGFRAINLFLRLRRCGFRTFVHPFSVIAAAAEREGLALVQRERQGVIWENAVFERLAPGAAGNPLRMEPRHRESEAEHVAAERAADATEDSREQHAERDAAVEDEPTRHEADAELDEETQI